MVQIHSPRPLFVGHFNVFWFFVYMAFDDFTNAHIHCYFVTSYIASIHFTGKLAASAFASFSPRAAGLVHRRR